MPYHIDDDSKGKCVIKDDTGETVKCHDTHEQAVEHMRALYAATEKEKSMNTKGGDGSVELSPESAITYGGAVKALSDGKIGGYLVTFGGLDMTGDYFDAKTDFGEYSRLPVLYHHGFDDKLKTRRIGTAEVKQDETGLWAEAQLEMRDEYEKMVYELAAAGKLGWSSGAASHVTKREEKSNGFHITQWYMAEASLTPCPAEPRNSVIPLKSFLGDNTATTKPEGDPETVKTVESEGKDKAESNKPILQGVKKMDLTKEELKALLDEGAENAVKKFRESEPVEKTADIKITKDEAEQPFKSAGSFFMAVKNAALYPGQTDKRLLPLKFKDADVKATGANEAIPSQGGYLIPQEVAPGITENIWKTGSLLSQFRAIPIEGNNMTFNMVDESSRADGSRYGGIRGYWLAEAAEKNATQPKWKQVELKLKKVAALVYATDELLEDVSALEGWINNTVPNELRFNVEDALINGTGAGMPMGILPSPALKTITRIDATQISTTDVANMWAGRYSGINDYIWLGNQFIFPQLLTMVVGTIPAYLPAGGLTGNPYATFFGRPYFDTEYNPALGEIGDLLLLSPSNYLMIEKTGGVKRASSIHVKFTADESVFRFVYRIDGSPAWNSTVTMNDGTNTVSPFVALTTST